MQSVIVVLCGSGGGLQSVIGYSVALEEGCNLSLGTLWHWRRAAICHWVLCGIGGGLQSVIVVLSGTGGGLKSVIVVLSCTGGGLQSVIVVLAGTRGGQQSVIGYSVALEEGCNL